jgi:hypothetical protein
MSPRVERRALEVSYACCRRAEHRGSSLSARRNSATHDALINPVQSRVPSKEGLPMHSRPRRRGVIAAAVMTAAVTTAAIGSSIATAADPCVSGAEVRAQVRELVASLRDDIGARSTRAHIAAALVDTLRTFRGVDANSPAERRELGQAIAALAKQLKSAPSLVARKAIVAEILALTEQRERGPFTAAERAELKAAVAALKKAIVARTDRAVEGREVAAAFSALHEQFTCRPA